jgi:hypothetical protein
VSEAESVISSLTLRVGVARHITLAHYPDSSRQLVPAAAGYNERMTTRFQQLAQSLGLVYSPEEQKRLDAILGRLALRVWIAAVIAKEIQFWLHR